MSPCTLSIYIERYEDIIALVLSLGIMSQALISVYCGVKMIALKTKNRFGWCPEMLVTYMSFIWFIVFGFIFLDIFREISLIDSRTLGVVLIRPIIFISLTIDAILQKRRYLKTVRRYAEKEYLRELFEKGGSK